MKVITAATVLLLSCLAAAQDYPKTEIFGGYSYLNVDTEDLTDRLHTHGWEASVTANVNRWFGVEANFSGHYKSDILGSGLNANQHSFLFGPHLAYRTHDAKVTPYAHALFGFDRASLGAFGVSISEKSFAMAFGGGMDYKLTRQVSLRLGQFDYLYTRHAQDIGGTHQNNFRVSAGIVLTLGGKETAPSTSASTAPTPPPNAVDIPSLGVSAVPGNRGLEVVSVQADSPAARAGIRSGDFVIAIDGKSVRTSEDVQNALAANASGTARITYMIRGQWQTEKQVSLK